jgi:Cellulase (glycosyl hydrolase family 5)
VSRAWFGYGPRLLAVVAISACTALLGASLASASSPSARKSIARLSRVERTERTHQCRHTRRHHRRRCVARRIRSSGRAWRSARSARNLNSAPAPTPTSPDFYGINGQWFSEKFMPASQWDAHLEGIHDAGFTSVRREAWWCDVEPNAPSGGAHDYRWAELDQFVTALARHQLRWYSTISQGASWAGNSWASPPSDQRIPDYAAFAAALAQRYGAGGSFWQAHPELPYEPVQDFEIWNEPNIRRFWVDGMSQSPARYGRMVAAATTAIHDVDPQARVDTGALAYGGAISAPDYIAQMVQANPGLQGQVSAVSFHPYGLTATRSLNRIVALRRAVDQWLGPDVSIEISEDGMTLPPGSPYTVDDRATLLSKLALTLPRTDCKISGFLPLSWTGQKQDPAQEDQWYGLADWTTAQLDPSGVALKNAVLRMEGRGSSPPPTGKVNLCYG